MATLWVHELKSTKIEIISHIDIQFYLARRTSLENDDLVPEDDGQ